MSGNVDPIIVVASHSAPVRARARALGSLPVLVGIFFAANIDAAPALTAKRVSNTLPQIAAPANDVDSARVAAELSLQERLLSFAPNLDGEHFVEPDFTASSAIDFCLSLVSALPLGAPLPQATRSDDSELGLTWLIGRDRLELIVSPTGFVTWLSILNDVIVPGGDEDIKGTAVIDVLLQVIGDFYERTAS